MLELRIRCKFLPQNFEHLENFIAPITYLPLHNNKKIIDVQNKRYKIIQEGKRLWLNYVLNTYEIQIKQYERQYQCDFIKLQSELLNNSTVTSTTNGSSSLFNDIKEYINYRINRLKKDIYNQISSSRRIILQNRQRSSSTKHSIGVSPEPYLNLISNPFNTCQWNRLSLGKIFL
jgi:hypothetical protein